MTRTKTNYKKTSKFLKYREIIEIIESNDICEYWDLIEFLNKIEKMNLWEVATSENNVLFFVTYLESRKRKKLEEAQRKHDECITKLKAE